MNYQEESVWETNTWEVSVYLEPDVQGQFIEFVREDETPPEEEN
jgi:hypothetical protein